MWSGVGCYGFRVVFFGLCIVEGFEFVYYVVCELEVVKLLDEVVWFLCLEFG